MFHKVEDFAHRWKNESNFTRSMMNQLTDASLSQAVADEHRTLGRIAWHIVTTIPEMGKQTGLKLDAVDHESPVPATAEEIKTAYVKAADQFAEQVKANWNDETLLVEDELYGEKWARGLTLGIMIRHEIHHRGQMTILMRQAGLIVPDIYGPAKEGWAKFGAPEPVV